MLPEPHASLLAGLLLGTASGLPDDFAQALRASGTTHIVVVSGYNISLVAGALLALFTRFRGFGVAAAIVMVWAFVALSGGAPPSVRAALMGTAALLAIRTGRGADALGALGLTSALMLALDPRLVLDLGFQLSVAATLGLITLQPRVAGLFAWLHPALREPLSGTIAAQLATLPLLAATFHQLSLVAPLSNLLAAPAVPLATIAGGIAVAIAGLLPVLSPILGALLLIPTSYLVAVIEATAGIPGATTPVGDVSPGAAWVYALALVAWAASPTPEGRDLLARLRTKQAARVVVATAAALVGATIAGTAVAGRDERPALTLSVLNVGGGDAVFVRTPEGRTVLVDGGPSPATLLAQLGRRFGLLEREISIAILTTSDSGLMAGPAAAIARYSPRVAIAPPGAPSPLYHRWQAAAGDRSLTATSGLTIDLEPGLALEVLPTRPAPTSGRPNAAPEPSLAVRLVHGDRAFLIVHSPTAEVLRGLKQDGWPVAADVIVTSGGGNDAGTPIAEWVTPSVAIVPALPRGRERSSPGTPSIPGLAATYRTDVHGSVEVRSDGERLTIRTERSAP
jgi:competence protein ComEC